MRKLLHFDEVRLPGLMQHLRPLYQLAKLPSTNSLRRCGTLRTAEDEDERLVAIEAEILLGKLLVDVLAEKVAPQRDAHDLR